MATGPRPLHSRRSASRAAHRSRRKRRRGTAYYRSSGHVDIMPTLLDGRRQIGNLRGQTLKPLLRWQRAHHRAACANDFGHYHWCCLATVTDGRYRYIRRADSGPRSAARSGRAQYRGRARRRGVIETLRSAIDRLNPQSAAAVDEGSRALQRLAMSDVGPDPAAGEAPDPKGMYHVLVSSGGGRLVRHASSPGQSRASDVVHADRRCRRGAPCPMHFAGTQRPAADAYKHVLAISHINIAAHLAPPLRWFASATGRARHARLAARSRPAATSSHSSAHRARTHCAHQARWAGAPGKPREESRPALPLPLFVDRASYDQAHYADAAALRAGVAAQHAAKGRAMPTCTTTSGP